MRTGTTYDLFKRQVRTSTGSSRVFKGPKKSTITVIPNTDNLKEATYVEDTTLVDLIGLKTKRTELQTELDLLDFAHDGQTATRKLKLHREINFLSKEIANLEQKSTELLLARQVEKARD